MSSVSCSKQFIEPEQGVVGNHLIGKSDGSTSDNLRLGNGV